MAAQWIHQVTDELELDQRSPLTLVHQLQHLGTSQNYLQVVRLASLVLENILSFFVYKM